jgi:hypothetical protein
MLKYVRIAVTALSLTACVLLVALWVRSYWHFDYPEGPHISFYANSKSIGGTYIGTEDTVLRRWWNSK